ncbi:MAG: hypothetical protein H2212_03595 [Ruminococcus sp.]|nr:hypothetical protein [Ruminococcus sp.]
MNRERAKRKAEDVRKAGLNVMSVKSDERAKEWMSRMPYQPRHMTKNKIAHMSLAEYLTLRCNSQRVI